MSRLAATPLDFDVAADFAAREIFKTDPDTALRFIQVKTIGTGVVVGLNLRY